METLHSCHNSIICCCFFSKSTARWEGESMGLSAISTPTSLTVLMVVESSLMACCLDQTYWITKNQLGKLQHIDMLGTSIYKLWSSNWSAGVTTNSELSGFHCEHNILKKIAEKYTTGCQYLVFSASLKNIVNVRKSEEETVTNGRGKEKWTIC